MTQHTFGITMYFVCAATLPKKSGERIKEGKQEGNLSVKSELLSQLLMPPPLGFVFISFGSFFFGAFQSAFETIQRGFLFISLRKSGWYFLYFKWKSEERSEKNKM